MDFNYQYVPSNPPFQSNRQTAGRGTSNQLHDSGTPNHSQVNGLHPNTNPGGDYGSSVPGRKQPIGTKAAKLLKSQPPSQSSEVVELTTALIDTTTSMAKHTE
ncbi:hypothetical protein DFH28DRAFT_1140784 [Melampsora americana]|nr:hypothetical protein DFH28DRAFT_1140784 [Melampsora americana]